MSLYRQYFTPQEIDPLDSSQPDDVTSEISLLRILLARVLEASRSLRELALKQHAAILSAFSRAGATIARLARLQCELHSPLDDLWAAIELGEEQARRHLHVYSYLASSPIANNQ